VTAVWIVVGVCVAAALVKALISSWRRHGGRTDLGAVSSQWIAEQRLMQGPTRRR
jgi:hypothetical protein